MHHLAERARATIRRYALVEPGGCVIVALSGGPDSVALLLLLRELEAAGDLSVVGVAHFNHQLRGEAADADEQFCRALAGSLGVPFEGGTADVRAAARAGRTSIENAARRARYAFLEAAADRLAAGPVAVGHTRHDQAETVLQKLFRGAGWRGLAGIHPRRGRFVRPLLEIGRDELRRYLAGRDQPFCADASNQDLTNPRNRIRHELVPYLETHLSPGVVEVLAREAVLARETADWLDTLARERASTEMRVDGDRVALTVASLTVGPAPVVKAFARLALQPLAGARFVGAEHVDALLALADKESGARTVDFPGQRAVRAGEHVLLTRRAGRGARRAPGNLFQEMLSVPGEVILPGHDCAVTAEPTHPVDGTAEAAGDPAEAAGDTAVVDSGKVTWPLTVRLRRPGDRFRPPGLGGRKKLQDFFIDRKVPRDERDRVPIIVDADDRIVWVAGHAISDDFRASEGSAGVILLKRKRLGGVR